MHKLDVAELRSQIDIEGFYVDFSVLRTALSVSTVARDSGVQLSEPTFDGECRATCPKCGKDKSFAVNVNTNRFNCFAKGCTLKGGGVIDFFSKLHSIAAKDTSHLLARAYGIAPYSSEPVAIADETINPRIGGKMVESTPSPEVSITRSEFDELRGKFEKLSSFVWSYMLDNDAAGAMADEYDPPLTKHHITH